MPKAKGPKRLIEMEYVPVSRVRPNERNPYKEDPETFQALRRSVDKTGGIVDPIDVAPDSEPEKNSTWDASDKKGKWYVVIHLGKAVDAPQGPSPHVLKFLKKVAGWKFIPSKVYVNALHTKVGRNEPCPCGSGKKYKNCCGRGR